MIDDWFRCVKLPMSFDEFDRLPRHPAYKYEYIDGETWLTPRPNSMHALLDLTTLDIPAEPPRIDLRRGELAVRPIRDEDWPALPKLLAFAFHRVPPFGLLDDEEAVRAGEDCLGHTRGGGDGPLIAAASCVAEDEPGNIIGTLLVTLAPKQDLAEFWGPRWHEAPPPDCIERHLGRPHLMWIFVNPWIFGRGVGSQMLRFSAKALLAMGYCEIASSFLIGNERSMAWHWRNGFRLLPLAYSPRSWDAARRNRNS